MIIDFHTHGIDDFQAEDAGWRRWWSVPESEVWRINNVIDIAV